MPFLPIRFKSTPALLVLGVRGEDAMAKKATVPATTGHMFSNGDTVVWRKKVGLSIHNARGATREQLGEGPFGLSNLNVEAATCTLTLGNGRFKNNVPLAWIEGDGSDGA